MPEVRRLRKRGATVEVVAVGEILFAPGGPVPSFLETFTKKVARFARQEAPANKRPRWAHYGKPLKATILGTTHVYRGKSVFHIHSAVGSSAPHAYYVDQGTGVYNGSGPYQAKVLPPWQRGDPSLYEASWRPLLTDMLSDNQIVGDLPPKVAPVFIKGQRGQGFFDKALARGFAAMRMRAFQLPGEGAGGVSSIIRSEAAGLTGFLGNTPPSAGFQASLEEWRTWRDEAWLALRPLGRGGGIGTRAHIRETEGFHIAKRARAQRRVDTIFNLHKAAATRRRQEAADLAAKRERERQSNERLAQAEEKENEYHRKRAAANRLKEAYREASVFSLAKAADGYQTRIRPFVNGGGYRVEWIQRNGKTRHKDFKP